jgi:gliding motility-associated-like protein
MAQVGVGACNLPFPECGVNQVQNPDFSQGNVNFSASVTYATTFGACGGRYTIDNTSVPYSGTDNNQTTWDCMNDHTTGTGNFMIIDPPCISDGISAWYTLEVLDSNDIYAFKCFVTNLSPDPDNEPIITLIVAQGGTPPQNLTDGVILNSIRPIYDADPVNRWNELCGTFTAPVKGSYYFAVFVEVSVDGINGADCGLDDISVRKLAIVDEFQTVAACDSFVNTSGDIYYSDGQYTDTIINPSGCDSVYLYDLTILSSSSSNQVEVSCDQFVSPTGKVWTSSGNYNDTVLNNDGCDSIISYNITINTMQSINISVTACSEYITNDGAVFNSEGIHTETLMGANGCDSIVNYDLDLLNSSSSIFLESCDSIQLPSNQWIYQSGTYQNVIPNHLGCDSVITITANVMKTTFSTMQVEDCEEYLSPSGKIYTTEGQYKDTIPNQSGCDSIITIDFKTLNQEYFRTEKICDSFVEANGTVHYDDFNYTENLISSTGCDSIVYWEISVIKSNPASLFLDICNQYKSPSGKYIWTMSGNYRDTIFNMAGCDSLILIDLTIIKVGPAQITIDPPVIMALNENVTYQWVRCPEMTEIEGATQKSHTATENGDYALVIYDGECSDTSNCVSIDSFEPNEEPDLKMLIPNVFTPDKDGINDWFGITANLNLEIECFILNRWGQVINSQKFDLIKNEFVPIWSGEDFNEGVYYYRVIYLNKNQEKKEQNGFFHLER